MKVIYNYDPPRRTAEQLQAKGAELAKEGVFVPVVSPSEVPFYVKHNQPHIVRNQIPKDNCK